MTSTHILTARVLKITLAVVIATFVITMLVFDNDAHNNFERIIKQTQDENHQLRGIIEQDRIMLNESIQREQQLEQDQK